MKERDSLAELAAWSAMALFLAWLAGWTLEPIVRILESAF